MERRCRWKFRSGRGWLTRIPRKNPVRTTKPRKFMQKIRVLLADDHTVVRQGLKALLSAEEDIEIVGEADTGRQAVQMAKKLQPDVVVMDIAMPLLNGLEATRQIIKGGTPT